MVTLQSIYHHHGGASIHQSPIEILPHQPLPKGILPPTNLSLTLDDLPSYHPPNFLCLIGLPPLPVIPLSSAPHLQLT